MWLRVQWRFDLHLCMTYKMLSASRNIYRKVIHPPILATLGVHFKHTLPDLPYDYNALEPHISAEIMQLHHQKHHAAYVNNLNIAEEKLKEALGKNDTSTIISLQPALKFNGGGHINHTIFWEILGPKAGGEPTGELLNQIKKDFGSFENMRKELVAVSVGVQGSGWGWLGYSPAKGHLCIASCANQDPLEATTGLVPLFGIDVWEHAYYLQYKNLRPGYVSAIFNVANWGNVSKRFEKAKLAFRGILPTNPGQEWSEVHQNGGQESQMV